MNHARELWMKKKKDIRTYTYIPYIHICIYIYLIASGSPIWDTQANCPSINCTAFHAQEYITRYTGNIIVPINRSRVMKQFSFATIIAAVRLLAGVSADGSSRSNGGGTESGVATPGPSFGRFVCRGLYLCRPGALSGFIVSDLYEARYRNDGRALPLHPQLYLSRAKDPERCELYGENGSRKIEMTSLDSMSELWSLLLLLLILFILLFIIVYFLLPCSPVGFRFNCIGRRRRFRGRMILVEF